jgi:hypothetical protein
MCFMIDFPSLIIIQSPNDIKRPLKNAHFCSSSRKAKILTTGIHCVFWGLKFEPDPREIGLAFHGASAEIGQKEGFAKVS